MSESQHITQETEVAATLVTPRQAGILRMLSGVIKDLTGADPGTVDPQVSFFELGVDSLLLLQATQKIEDRFDVQVPFRLLFEDLSTLGSLAAYIDQELPADAALPELFEPETVAEVTAETTYAEVPAHASETLASEGTQAEARAVELSPETAAGAREELRTEMERHGANGERPQARANGHAAPREAAREATPNGNGTAVHAPGSLLERVMLQQLQLMTQQLQVLGGARRAAGRATTPQAAESAEASNSPLAATHIPAADNGSNAAQPSLRFENDAATAAAAHSPVEARVETRIESAATKAGADNAGAAGASAEVEPASVESATRKPFVPYRPIEAGTKGGLTPQQQAYLEDFTARYIKRTGESKRQTQEYRPVVADPRVSMGFRMLWKELVYPIIVDRSAGSRVWDVDGNEYIDLAMGFGVNLFGHNAPFIREALEQQLRQGIQLGPMSHLNGPVSRLVCELTGMERALLCNSGTEAVMTALRLARTVRKRNRVVIFAGSYHGSFDGVLARARNNNADAPHALPMAPGVPPGMVEDVLVLDYDNPRSLEIIEAQAGELAAVLVEPVQSRRADIQPREFLRRLRRITEETGVALIFDEVITGFRSHPGGAQAWFGVKADLATYGKVIGGGMPIGVVAGRADYMDALDGGAWNYGDGSLPRAQQTFFAGTFCKHPLALSAAHAVLTHLKTEGPQLQERLNERAARLVAELNDFFTREDVPVRVLNFASLLSFIPSGSMKFMDLLFYHMALKGVYTWEGRTCFLSTAHTEEDIGRVTAVVKESIAEMRAGGLLPVASDAARGATESPAATAAAAPPPETTTRRVALTDLQKQVWILAQMGEEVSRAYNESVTLDFRGVFDIEALRRAVNRLVERHEALRTTFAADGEYQEIHPHAELDVPLVDFSMLDAPEEQQAAVSKWLAEEVRLSFDLGRAPLARLRLLKLAPEHHQLVSTIHHIVADGPSYGIFLYELGALYTAECGIAAPPLQDASQFSDFAKLEERQQSRPSAARDEAYWLSRFETVPPATYLPSDRPRTTYGITGGRYNVTFDSQFREELSALSGRSSTTLFMTLMAGFKMLVHQLTGQDDIVVGMNAVSQTSAGAKSLVGYRVNPLGLRSRLDGDPTFAEYLASVKGTVLDALQHQSYPIGKLLKKLNIRRERNRSPLVMAGFLTLALNLDHFGAGPDFHGLEVEIIPNPPASAKIDLFVDIMEMRGQLVFKCDYNADLFDEQTIARWIDHLHAILRAVAANPGMRFSQLPSLDAAPPPSTELAPTVAELPEVSVALEVSQASNMSYFQTLLWLGHALEPGAPTFNLAYELLVPASIDPEHFRAAFRALVSKSDSMRSVVEEIGGQPVRRVLPDIPFEVEVLDFSDAPDPRASMRQWSDERCSRPFDIAKRMFDCALIKCGAEEFGICLVIHHIISDAWGFGVSIEYLSELYERSVAGRLDEEFNIPQFQDYIHYERNYLATPRASEAKAFWERKLAVAREPISFYGNTATGRLRYVKRIIENMGRERSERLRAAARREEFFNRSEEITLSNIVTALLCAFIYRVSGVRQISLGIPFHNRRTPDFKACDGLFMKIPTYRIGVEEDDTFLSLTRRAAAAVAEALPHRDYPVGNPTEGQHYEVECNFIARSFPLFHGRRVGMRWLHSGRGTETFAFQVNDYEGKGAYDIDFDFDTAVFDEEQRARAIRHFFHILDTFLADPLQSISYFDLLSPEESRLVLHDYNRTETEEGEEGVVELFETHARRTPDAVAVGCAGLTLTYAELDRLSTRVARRLARRGAAPERVVAVLAERGAG
ncbi:MAG TPA: aminotransferase class III-fold pyridoxal phosphate-dependent enzyme, partial [Pyrinomonadaceae bacterium]|nr:aminotransferase class III-fold pyridoxal phosphate-dependent enzyme [Pyrinomonadaceae bacterium]